MPHVIKRPGVIEGTALAVFLALVHTVNDAITAILGALLPTLQVRFDAGPSLLAIMVAVWWIASSVTQPLLGALAEDLGLRLIGALGVLFAAIFLSLVVVFFLIVVGGIGSAALHPVGTTVAGGPTVRNRALGVGFFTAGGMIGFALGPVLILYLIAELGTDVTPWLMIPGVLLAGAVYVLLPEWEPHGRRPIRDLISLDLLRGPVGMLAIAGSLTSLAFITFTSSVPLWLVREHGRATDDPLIGWTLAAFSLAAGLGALTGGVLAPRLGRRTVMVGSLSTAPIPLLAVLALDPGSVAFFAATFLAGVLVYASNPVKVVVAQDLAPHAPAAASGTILGVTAGIAGLLYVGLGRLQELAGLTAGMAMGFAMVIPAGAVAMAVLLRHPEAAR